jgi:DivIVA domain-containing protein
VEDDERAAAAQPGSEEPSTTKTDIRPARGRTFLPDVTGVEFSNSRRGYDREQVDRYVEQVSRIVVELEAMRSPDAVIERALADVGEETSAILRRARKAAEEIVTDAHTSAQQRAGQAEAQAREITEQADSYSTRVRADADKHLTDARAEAEHLLSSARAEADDLLGRAKARADELVGSARKQADQLAAESSTAAQRTRTEADEYQDRVIRHLEGLAQDRHRLIEDLRKLADQFHRTADRAVEQIPVREQGSEAADGNRDPAPAEQH